jgi:aldose 1-epimerase
MRATTGEQYELSLGDVRAAITEVGAGIRQLSVAGVQLAEPWDEFAPRPFFAGATLVPWPNRVRGGQWTSDGAEQQLDVTEPELGHALHGLLADRPFDVESRDASSITLAATIYPIRGYFFQLDYSVRYELTAGGIRVTQRVGNVGVASAPAAFGAHPFLRVGDVPVGQLTVQSSARSFLEQDARQIPTGSAPTAGTDRDLRAGRVVDELYFDDTFADLELVDGLYRQRLSAPDGRFVEVWQEPDFDHVHVFVTRIFPGPDGLTTAIAIEPMTAPPDAFNSGTGVRWLEPGDTWSASWGIEYQGIDYDGSATAS